MLSIIHILIIMEEKYRQSLKQFIEQMEVFNETKYEDGLQELEEKVTRLLQE